MNTPNPKARRQNLLIEALPGELLVYDQNSHRAHCLNAAAAAVFRSADGSLSVVEIACAASDGLGEALSEDLVWLALEELEKNGLLETALSLAPERRTRRTIFGLSATALLPFVLAISAPTPAYAQSLGETGPVGGSGFCG